MANTDYCEIGKDGRMVLSVEAAGDVNKLIIRLMDTVIANNIEPGPGIRHAAYMFDSKVREAETAQPQPDPIFRSPKNA